MNFRISVVAIVLLSLFASTAWTAEISVAPGGDTLAAAVAGASDGDTLVLQDGGFSGAVTVNKSLTIRPVNRATNAVVYGPVSIDGSGITVTLQGLKFSGDVNLTQAAAIRLLENEWVSGDIDGYGYRSSQGDGSLVIVGNRLARGSDIMRIHSDGAYIAGNVLFGGWIETHAYVWVVGNDVHNRDSFSIAIHTSSAGSSAFLLGNRVSCSVGYFGGSQGCIDAESPFNLIAGNIVEFNDEDINVHEQNGIYAAGTGEAKIVNNVVRGMQLDATRSGAAIAVYAGGARVAGNIVVNWVSSSGTPIYVESPTPEVTHNLCYNNTGGCPVGGDNLNAAPQFVDLVDFELDVGSPAVDAGPPDHNLADLDRTRNDMGAHGGPWSIGQYDAQRDPDNLAPYVYPLLKIESMVSGGILEMQTLGVARLR